MPVRATDMPTGSQLINLPQRDLSVAGLVNARLCYRLRPVHTEGLGDGARSRLLSRVQWAWVISWHILLPAFTVGLASYIAVLEGLLPDHRPARLTPGFPRFGPGCSRSRSAWAWCPASPCRSNSAPIGAGFSDATANMISPLMAYEGLSGFRPRSVLSRSAAVRPAAGARGGCIFSPPSWWRWAHCFPRSGFLRPTAGCRRRAVTTIVNGRFFPTDWLAIVFSPSFPFRLTHNVNAFYITTALW